MANQTYTLYTGNGSLTTFGFTFPTFTEDEVKVEVDGELQSSGYTIPDYNQTNGGTVTFTSAPAATIAQNVRIYRETNVASPKVDYQVGAPLRAQDLDRNQAQAIRALKEQGEQIRLGEGNEFHINHFEQGVKDNNAEIRNIVDGGKIKIMADIVRLINRDDTKNLANFNDGGGANIYYDNANKLEVKATGVNLPATTGGLDPKLEVSEKLALQYYTTGAKVGNAEIRNDNTTSGQGKLKIMADTVRIINRSDTKNLANFTDGGSAKLYYDNAEKIETTATGIKINHSAADPKIDFADGTNRLAIQHYTTGAKSGNAEIRNDNTSGNLKLMANTVRIINQADTKNLANFTDGGAAKLFYDNAEKIETTATGIDIPASAQDPKITFNGANKLAIQYYTTGAKVGNAEIRNDNTTSGQGKLKLMADTVRIINQADTKNLASFTDGAEARLYYNNAEKIETTATGVDILASTADPKLTFNGANKLAIQYFTTGDKVGNAEIRNDNTTSGQGKLKLMADTVRIINRDDTENLASFQKDGACTLYYDNSPKFETTSAGTKVTGNLEVTGTYTGDFSGNAGTATDLAAAAKITNSEHATHTANDTTYYTTSAADARYYRLGSVEEIQSGETWVAADNKVATTSAIDARITDLVDDVGGFVPIANETSFPNANPDVNNGAGTLVSVKALASALTSNGSGVATISNGTVGNSTVTINGLANSTTYAAGVGILVETTTTLNTYTFHRQVPDATSTTTVAGSIGNVNTVATNISNVNSVAGNNTNINTVAGNNSNINTVAGANSNIGTVATNISDVNNFADLYQIATSAPSTDGGGNSLANGDLWYDSSSNKQLKVYSGTAFQAVSPTTAVLDDIAIVSGDLTRQEDLGSIADALASATTTSDLATCADNITNINTFANVYRISANAPSSSLDEGDLWYDSTANVLKYYTGSAWTVTAGSGLSTVGDDTSPELGGHLDCNNKNLTEVATVSGDNLQIDFGSIA